MTMISRLAFVLLLCLPAFAQASWWNKDWSYRKQITVDTTAAGAGLTSGLQDVPVLVRLHTGNFTYFLDMKSDGSDLRFIAGDDKTPLKYHVEKFDPINEMALIWVKVPQLPAAAKTENFWMYYGNSDAKAAGDAAGTYDVAQSLVYHFGEAAGAPKDETAYGNNASASTAQPIPAGLIGAGEHFDGKGAITIPATPSLRLTADKGWTFSAWVKIDGPQQDAYLMQMQDGGQALVLGISGTDLYARLGGAQTPATAQVAPGAWHHVALVAGSGALTLYVDGAQAATVPAPLQDMGGVITVGGASDQTHGFVGDLDELGIAATVRSADWIRAEVRGEGVGANLLAYGEDKQLQGSDSGSTSYFGVILSNVTSDGWVVIIVLSVMAAISWVVMLGKGLLISRIHGDNKKFLREFEQLGGADPARLDAPEDDTERDFQDSPLSMALFGKHDHFQSSPLYRIYHAGVRQVKSRVGTAVGAQASGLSPQAIAAIRAALDAAQVRETQRLNAQMVLLTIAISGGPFLGLLGTVVGVMITFAAIAATGDVNVAAIAPGIAAALVATVAGLAVAIPALFGYNYLGSRIKDMVADMHVFIDEFVTKIAEHYA